MRVLSALCLVMILGEVATPRSSLARAEEGSPPEFVRVAPGWKIVKRLDTKRVMACGWQEHNICLVSLLSLIHI